METSNIMIVAGSEATASTLSGITSYSVKNPDPTARLDNEIRQTLEADFEIKYGPIPKLPYWNPDIEEG